MSEDNRGISWPQHIHRPYRVLWFEMDDLCILGFSLYVAFMYVQQWWAIILVPVPEYLYYNVKKKNPRGFFKHIAYSSGLVVLKHYPGYFQEEFYE